MVNNIKDDTISEIDAQKILNALNEIKKAEIIKYKKRAPGHKKLLNLFKKLLNIILTDKTWKQEKVESRKEENEDEDYENKYENEHEDEYYEYENECENENEDESIKGLNDNLDEIIDKSKSFEEQIELLKKLEDLKEYLPYKNYDDKMLKSKYFKIELADIKWNWRKGIWTNIWSYTYKISR